MRRRRDRRWLLLGFLALMVTGREGHAQTGSLPPALEDGVGARMPTAPAPAPAVPTSAIPTRGDPPVGIPINLATAFRLAGVSPLDIAAAEAVVNQSLAQLLQAKVLWVPNMNGGVDYLRHDGVFQNIFTGALFVKGRQSFFTGGGPSLSVGVTDAIFEPLAARQVVVARRADLQAAMNDVLQRVAQAFFNVQEARGRVVGLDATIERAVRVVRFAEGLAPELIAPLEINRARTLLESVLQDREVAIRDWRIASAQLAEILLLDPSALLEPVEPPFLQVDLLPCVQTAEELVAVALRNRPELASNRALLIAADQRLRQEKARPLLPNLFVLSPTTGTGLIAAGNFAAGANDSLRANGSRADFEVAAVWELQNMGIGNVGRMRQRRAERDVASIEVTRTIFRVRSDVAQAMARVETARARVPVVTEGLRQAIESADKNFIGLRETSRPAGELLRLIVRPQEVVAALQQLTVAFANYFGAINQYNAAQFDLYHALGQPAQWIGSRINLPPSPPPRTAPPTIPPGSPPPGR